MNEQNGTAAAVNPNVNTTTSAGLSAEMKTYYDLELITLAEAELVHDQFGQKRDIPKNGGKSIEFRQFDPLPEATEPLTEGVTPDGQAMSAKTVTATLKQYGGYITLSDMVQLTAADQILTEATLVNPTTKEILYALAQQDMVALRAVMRLGWEIPNPINALKTDKAERFPFAVLKAGE